MKLRNLKETAQIIDAAGGMRVEAGQVSGNIPKPIAESLLANQPTDWAEVKKSKPTKGGK